MNIEPFNPFDFHAAHPLLAFIALLIATILYRFIPRDRTVDLQSLISLAGTIKDKKQPTIYVNTRLAMMVIISLAVLGSSLYTILANTYDDGTRKWAYASIGTIIGFWLKN